MKNLTQEDVRRLLYYRKRSGVLRWRLRDYKEFENTHDPIKFCNSWNKQFAYRVAGGYSSQGYQKLKIYNTQYFSHRIIWLYVNGYTPEYMIDHIDGNRSNNRLDNLRHVTNSCNIRNAKKPSNNTSGVVGISWNTNGGQWIVSIKLVNERIHLGYFKHLSDAVVARYRAEVKYDFLKCKTISSAYIYLQEHNLINEVA